MFGKECGGGRRGPFAGGGPFGGPWAGHGGSPCGGHGPLGKMLKGLDLTDEQLFKIAELKGSALGKMARGKIDLMELKKEIFKELLQPQVDKNKVRSVAEKIKEHKATCLDSILENMIAFSELLSPEQKRQLALNKIRCFLGLEEADDDNED